MYTLLFILFAAPAAWLIYKGIRSHKRSFIVLGSMIGLLTLLVTWFLGFWGEKLWFDELGFDRRFWTVFLTRLVLFAGAFLVGGVLIFLITFSLKENGSQKRTRIFAVLTGALISGFLMASHWETVLLFLHRIPTAVREPVLHMQTGFYLFTYPFLSLIYSGFLYLSIIALAASLAGNLKNARDSKTGWILKDNLEKNRSLFLSAGIFLIVLACGKFIKRYGLLYSAQGIVSGPGWTDANIRLPMLLIMAVITAIAGIAMMIPSARNSISRLFSGRGSFRETGRLVTIPVLVFSLWFITLLLVPGLFQWLKVQPNEISVEKPYIKNNIEFTRYGYGLHHTEEVDFPVSEEFSEETVSSNRHLLNNIRLWDYRALDAVFKQFQEIRLYYEFLDVDIDRYTIDSTYNEVMISAREMNTGNLPEQSQTFVNKRFKYTHGYGVTLNRVNEFTGEGLPNLLVKDIPPVSESDDLAVTRPEIYYGEMTGEFVVVNSEEKEFDYPQGENNIYVRYGGNGGMQLSNLWRKFLFGAKLGGTRFFLSGYPTTESRIMFHRQIRNRAETLAPFLKFDGDPYIVLQEGRLFWIIDAYTTSGFYPYSESFSSLGEDAAGGSPKSLYAKVSNSLRSENYIRNSVKITVDAYTGEVNFYIFEKEDPLVQVYKKIFPELLKDRSEMPPGLNEHVRYPADMLMVQGLVYAKYHMTDPDVFYNQEDLWVRATEKYYSAVRPVEPYYIMWEQPGSNEMEFALILPFTPKNKQVMIGWIAGLCDGVNYGRFLAYRFPKEKRILGPQQVETKIDQDSYLSAQLTLWDQRGSNVIRGNVLAIPIDGTIIYVEPIYLQSETSAYPELRLVAVMHNDQLSYAENFEDAIKALYEKAALPKEAERIPGTVSSTEELIGRANAAFENYLQSMQEKNFKMAGEALEELQRSLKQLEEATQK